MAAPNIIRVQSLLCVMLLPISDRKCMAAAALHWTSSTRHHCSQGDINFADGSREDTCAIAFDTKGPEIRTGAFDEGFLKQLAEGEGATAAAAKGREVTYAAGDYVTLCTKASLEHSGSKDRLYVDYPPLASAVHPGSPILLDDGLLQLTVQRRDLSSGEVYCTVDNHAQLGERKGLALPGVAVALPSISDKDRADLQLAVELGADFVFASFVREAAHVHEIKGIVGHGVKVISKIENQQGLDNIDEILAASDGLMVARGDLGIQIPSEQVFLAQRLLTAKGNLAGKPVICATQMLDSMIRNPRPTRAETVDVASAVLDGADAVMLSGETAKGAFPIQAVEAMSRICLTAEAAYDYRSAFAALQEVIAAQPGKEAYRPSQESLASAAVHAAFAERAKVIIAITASGSMPKLLSKYRPKCPVLAVTNCDATARQLMLYKNVHAIIGQPGEDVDSLTQRAITAAKAMGVAAAGDRAVLITGSAKVPVAGDTSGLRFETVW